MRIVRLVDRQSGGAVGSTDASGDEPVADLDDPRALDASLVGSKAASLARSRRAGLHALPGFVLTTEVGDSTGPAVAAAWARLGGDRGRPLAVRSSSPVEDTATSSMAGRFRTVLDVTSWSDFVAAVAEVRQSAHGKPMAVLVQPMLQAELGGILFGVDPVSGERHLVVEWLHGNPEPLVSGQANGDRTTLSRRGRRLAGAPLPGRVARRLARMARAAERLNASPQDLEWAADEDGVWLLQSRPVTRAGAALAGGPRLGRGPVAETFPMPLAPLEAGLWLPPLRDGIESALRLTGSAGRRACRRSPIVTAVGGWVVVDLDLLEGPSRSGWRLLDPLPPARRLGAAWTVGRLRLAMPSLVGRLLRETDRQLAAVPAPSSLDDAALLSVLDRSSQALRSIHAHEVLAGALLEETGTSLIGLALRALADERAIGGSDPAIASRRPEVLSLVPPRIASAPPDLGPTPSGLDAGSPGTPSQRESLRLRARWLQELQARTVAELAGRLRDRGVLPITDHDAVELIRQLTPDELVLAVELGRVPADLRTRPSASPSAAPPAVFRLAEDGRPVNAGPAPIGGGIGAGGGRGVGEVGTGPGAVMVVSSLDPSFAVSLPGLAGLVAETGAVLAHLAILAREQGIPTVVGVAGAVDRFPAGSVLLVDGDTGEVRDVTTGGDVTSSPDLESRP